MSLAGATPAQVQAYQNHPWNASATFSADGSQQFQFGSHPFQPSSYSNPVFDGTPATSSPVAAASSPAAATGAPSAFQPTQPGQWGASSSNTVPSVVYDAAIANQNSANLAAQQAQQQAAAAEARSGSPASSVGTGADYGDSCFQRTRSTLGVHGRCFSTWDSRKDCRDCRLGLQPIQIIVSCSWRIICCSSNANSYVCCSSCFSWCTISVLGRRR